MHVQGIQVRFRLGADFRSIFVIGLISGAVAMNWDALGAVGEIVGAVAVVATLVYLSIQIRQNTKSERASALDASINAFSAVR